MAFKITTCSVTQEAGKGQWGEQARQIIMDIIQWQQLRANSLFFCIQNKQGQTKNCFVYKVYFCDERRTIIVSQKVASIYWALSVNQSLWLFTNGKCEALSRNVLPVNIASEYPGSKWFQNISSFNYTVLLPHQLTFLVPLKLEFIMLGKWIFLSEKRK